MKRNLLITGAAGFIGSTLARLAASAQNLSTYERCILYDKLTYAGYLGNIEELIDHNRTEFIHGDISDFDLVLKTLKKFAITDIIHLAAESHVDNSITGPKPFIETNISGTFNLLEAARKHWQELDIEKKSAFRFLHVSTDEVFGELGEGGYFTEMTPYRPNSPYSASKAASDHLARAWQHTYGLPVIVTNCSNNYGPRQFPEKLIPRMIDCALHEQPLPVYGKGENVRDWIHTEDHGQGLLLALTSGRPGETYCFGGRAERKNIDVVKAICHTLDELHPRESGKKYDELIHFVTDRPGHDWRYAIDDKKAETELGFKRKYKNFEDGLKQTIKWYLTNTNWIEKIKAKKH
ncbi:MAG: dTDP-glucose 4,6-dehydratase [Bdellovibrionales bacterium RBG_16_40_8]|nr:MAG: dTDP-glucose 4,6-dehydratase [Bdellovibrionales bacterium RBG_16_40_8]